MASRKRFGIRQVPGGGVSIGWTSLNSLYRCPRRGYWTLIHGGTGMQLPPMPPAAPVLYGQLWHAGYRALWKGEAVKESLLEHLADEELSAEMYVSMVDEVQLDLDWYWNQDRGGLKGTVLACEEELMVVVQSPWTGLTHELRGTPDLVLEADSVVMPDHKTFGVLSYTQKGTPRLELAPREATVAKYQITRQFPFYCFLWNELHPDKKCFDPILNMVPSHATAVEGILSDRGPGAATLRIHRIPLEPYVESYVNEVGLQAVRMCDKVAVVMGSPLSTDALSMFHENESACVDQYGGGVCPFYALDRADPELRSILLQESFVKKD